MSFRIIKRLSIGSCIICSIIQQGWGKFHHLDGFTPKRRPCALQNIDRRKICTRINLKTIEFPCLAKWRSKCQKLRESVPPSRPSILPSTATYMCWHLVPNPNLQERWAVLILKCPTSVFCLRSLHYGADAVIHTIVAIRVTWITITNKSKKKKCNQDKQKWIYQVHANLEVQIAKPQINRKKLAWMQECG